MSTKQQPPKQPATSLLDPRFKYTPAVSTDIRKTFERERKRLQQQTEKR